ncbi:nucleotide pyrophosphohydrolase [uncultured Corynebacterium sp.]|uniref:nucleotide pyrophosphohydrolase n=1 Tax=uncultured Corynebacterium sp. TaxID=159447 RepID=UPI0025CCA583|nr:nucleotide pyrophosphohydrolase [uncultured Corynebacterium sp.]
MSTEHLMKWLWEFSQQRDWGQFHTPENLAKSISIEAAELLECFQWSMDGQPTSAVEEVRDELADVMTYCLYLAMSLDLDPEKIILDKLDVTERKYPVEKARGRSDKYDKL